MKMGKKKPHRTHFAYLWDPQCTVLGSSLKLEGDKLSFRMNCGTSSFFEIDGINQALNELLN